MKSSHSIAMLLALGLAVFMSLMPSAAMASTTIPGVGIIVKKKPGNAPIAKGASDNQGQVSFNLEPGEYSITVGDNKPQDFVVRRGESGIKLVVTGEKTKYQGDITPLRGIDKKDIRKN